VVQESANGRFCCKSLFTLVIKISFGCLQVEGLQARRSRTLSGDDARGQPPYHPAMMYVTQKEVKSRAIIPGSRPAWRATSTAWSSARSARRSARLHSAPCTSASSASACQDQGAARHTWPPRAQSMPDPHAADASRPDLATGRVIAAALVRFTAVDARNFRNFGAETYVNARQCVLSGLPWVS
jgi:hypothetical protein